MKSKEFLEVHENKFDSAASVNSEDTYSEVEAESVEDSSDPEESDSNEVSETETVSVVSYDYTSYFENIQNANTFQGACLVAIIILLGLLMGLRKHD